MNNPNKSSDIFVFIQLFPPKRKRHFECLKCSVEKWVQFESKIAIKYAIMLEWEGYIFYSRFCILSGSILQVARTVPTSNAAPSALSCPARPQNDARQCKLLFEKDAGLGSEAQEMLGMVCSAVAPCGLIGMQIQVRQSTDTWPGHVKWCANLINNWCQQQHLPVKCWVVPEPSRELLWVRSKLCGLWSTVCPFLLLSYFHFR